MQEDHSAAVDNLERPCLRVKQKGEWEGLGPRVTKQKQNPRSSGGPEGAAVHSGHTAARAPSCSNLTVLLLSLGLASGSPALRTPGCPTLMGPGLCRVCSRPSHGAQCQATSAALSLTVVSLGPMVGLLGVTCAASCCGLSTHLHLEVVAMPDSHPRAVALI